METIAGGLLQVVTRSSGQCFILGTWRGRAAASRGLRAGR